MRIFFAVLVGLGLACGSAAAQEENYKGETGLALPRFVSLHADKTNARSGPGSRYPIEWVYLQKGAPVEVIAEFELWRKIKDWQGSESWVHKITLNGRRTVKVITPGENNIYAKDNYQSRVIAKVEDEVVGEIEKCPAKNNFCLVKFGSVEGWISRQNLYGIYPDEIVD